MTELCFWSVADGEYAYMLQALVDSYRRVGMSEDFHVFCDRPIAGATQQPLGRIDKTLYLFKLRLLQERVSRLPYGYFAFLDADNYFVRKPRSILELMQGAPVHSSLESDCCDPAALRPDWWGCPLQRYVALMRERGVESPRVFNVNAGFFVVAREAVTTFFELAMSFWEHARAAGHTFTEEAPLAYATHRLCKDPELHLMSRHFDVWSCDWIGNYSGRLPDGQPWIFRDYMTGRDQQVNPAIVHAMRSKHALAKAGARRGAA